MTWSLVRSLGPQTCGFCFDPIRPATPHWLQIGGPKGQDYRECEKCHRETDRADRHRR